MSDSDIYLGMGQGPRFLLGRRANRHGLIAGATGTGKTVSLRVLAEGFSRLGVPVFLADVKGDLSGLARPDPNTPAFAKRAARQGLANYAPAASPVVFWDVFGESGHPLRATVADLGSLLFSRLLALNDVQQGVMDVVFAVAEDEDLPLLDFADLRAVLAHVADNASNLRTRYGNISPQSVGAIQRRLLGLEREGAEQFFGEPELEIEDLLARDPEGRGYVNVLAAERLIHSPKLYAIFLMWLLSRLFLRLPEVGDPERPRLVFFFDEAHLLFDDAPAALVDKVEQVVRLIRSKGVGVYFVTQSPADVPDEVLAQLGNRVQHALRAFTPRDQRAVRVAAETFRPNPAFKAADAIQELAVGEALVSTLDAEGVPTVVERTEMAPPRSRLTPLEPAERREVLAASPYRGKYDQALDRDSAHERLAARRREEALARPAADADPPPPGDRRRGGRRQGIAEAMAKSVARSIGSSLGRRIVRGVLDALFKR